MSPRSSRIPQLVFMLALVLAAIATSPSPAFAQDEAARFAEILAAQEGVTPLAGPFTANLKEAEGSIAFSWAAVNLENFHARAVFDVPETVSETPWDIGFIFGTTPTGTLRIAADSLGSIWFSVGAAVPTQLGSTDDINTAAGESNTLDLLVAGQRAFLGVNGALVATVDLPADASAADVAVGTAFYTDQTLIDRVTRFRDFVILPLDPDALAPAATPVATPTTVDREAFNERLAELEGSEPVAGPFAGRLVEATPGTVPLAPAGVSLADFAAVATFTNPEDPSLGLWDSGFQFRVNGDERNRIVVDSLGDVYADLADGQTQKVANAPSFDDAPGADNTLQLVVEGDRALFGVNGEFVAAIELPVAPVASDVLVGSGFFNEDFVVGRVTDYRDFQVWEIA